MNTTISKRDYPSSHHLWAAEHFTKLAKEIENAPGRPRFDLRHRAYVVAAITSSVAFLEAAVNEIFDDVADQHMTYVGVLTPEVLQKLAELWRPEDSIEGWRTLEKYQEALGACGAQRFDKGVAPYQDVQLVIDLRNELVHARAQTASVADKDQVERRRLMRPKFAPNKKAAAGDPYFRDHNLGADCAEWAVKSARAFADQFFVRTNIEPNYQRVDFSLNDGSQAHGNRWWASARRAACWLRSWARWSKDC